MANFFGEGHNFGERRNSDNSRDRGLVTLATDLVNKLGGLEDGLRKMAGITGNGSLGRAVGIIAEVSEIAVGAIQEYTNKPVSEVDKRVDVVLTSVRP